PIPEWERMIMVREFHAHHRNDPGFAQWFEQAKLLSGMLPLIQILRLDLLGRPGLRSDPAKQVDTAKLPASMETASQPEPDEAAASQPPEAVRPVDPSVPEAPVARSRWADWIGWGASSQPEPMPANDDELPLSVILDEGGNN